MPYGDITSDRYPGNDGRGPFDTTRVVDALSCPRRMDDLYYELRPEYGGEWTSAPPPNSTATQIGIDAGASNLYWRTLSQYSRLTSGWAVTSDLIHNSK